MARKKGVERMRRRKMAREMRLEIRLPAWAPVVQLRPLAKGTFESNVSEDNFIVSFGVIFIGDPFEDGGNEILGFH